MAFRIPDGIDYSIYHTYIKYVSTSSTSSSLSQRIAPPSSPSIIHTKSISLDASPQSPATLSPWIPGNTKASSTPPSGYTRPLRHANPRLSAAP